jgi:hypothetical protein
MLSIPFTVSIVAGAFVAMAAAGPINTRQAAGSITCNFGEPNNIVTADITNTIDLLNAGSSIPGLDNGDPIFIGSVFEGFDTAKGTVGSFHFELDNTNPFKATHIAFPVLAQALQEYRDQCCGVFDHCIGGNTQVAGDTGLKVDLHMLAA